MSFLYNLCFGARCNWKINENQLDFTIKIPQINHEEIRKTFLRHVYASNSNFFNKLKLDQNFQEPLCLNEITKDDAETVSDEMKRKDNFSQKTGLESVNYGIKLNSNSSEQDFSTTYDSKRSVESCCSNIEFFKKSDENNIFGCSLIKGIETKNDKKISSQDDDSYYDVNLPIESNFHEHLEEEIKICDIETHVDDKVIPEENSFDFKQHDNIPIRPKSAKNIDGVLFLYPPPDFNLISYQNRNFVNMNLKSPKTFGDLCFMRDEPNLLLEEYDLRKSQAFECLKPSDIIFIQRGIVAEFKNNFNTKENGITKFKYALLKICPDILNDIDKIDHRLVIASPRFEKPCYNELIKELKNHSPEDWINDRTSHVGIWKEDLQIVKKNQQANATIIYLGSYRIGICISDFYKFGMKLKFSTNYSALMESYEFSIRQESQ